MIEFLILMFMYVIAGFTLSTALVLNSKKDQWYSEPEPREFFLVSLLWPLVLVLGLIQMWLNFLEKGR